ncbi:MAG: hypothetical protein J6A03_13840 [Lachnospiraceae bacterium]|nr:hypothetical protein [Lachnospiraceae bacterium]
MKEIITFPKRYRFGIEILKYENTQSGQLDQKIIICLRKESCPYPIVSPISSLLKCWISKSYKTQYDYANRIVSLLNYLYFDIQKINRFDEIRTEMIVDYLNYLTATGRSRSYVVESRRVLTHFFYYATHQYVDICDIDNTEFIINVKARKSVVVWPNLEINVLLPTAKTNQQRKINKLTNLNVDLILRFIELAMVESPNCALGFYFMFFGGLRGSEACHLTGDDISKKVGHNFFYLHIEDRILNPEDKYADLNQSKKNRRQMILVIPE